VDGGLSFEASHDHTRMSEPRIYSLRERTTLVHDDALIGAQPPRQGIVEICLRDGRRLRHHARAVRGTPANPMSWNEVVGKSSDLIAPVLGSSRTTELIDAVVRLESIGNIRQLAEILRVERSSFAAAAS
jgi:2-methylcitrate dehydratase PrpD